MKRSKIVSTFMTNKRNMKALSFVLASGALGNVYALESVVNLQTTEAGIHEVTYDSLASSGIDLSGVASQAISIVNQGQPVPIQIVGGDTFDSGSSIRFVAHQVDTLYTDTNVYTLQLDETGNSVSRIGVDATPIQWSCVGF